MSVLFRWNVRGGTFSRESTFYLYFAKVESGFSRNNWSSIVSIITNTYEYQRSPRGSTALWGPMVSTSPKPRAAGGQRERRKVLEQVIEHSCSGH